MKKAFVYFLVGGLSFSIGSCGGKEESEKETKLEESVVEVEEIDEEEVATIFGTYDMTDMVPDAGDKKLTAQDEK